MFFYNSLIISNKEVIFIGSVSTYVKVFPGKGRGLNLLVLFNAFLLFFTGQIFVAKLFFFSFVIFCIL